MSSNNGRLRSQLAFLVEVDKLKGVLRQTSPIGLERRENSAEHSWQVVLTALMLQEHANEPIDLIKVLTMLAIHDVVEVDVGDTFHYSKNKREDLAELEAAAAQRIFGLLPSDQAGHYAAIWHEFEAKETPEAKFANAVDRFIAFVMNIHNDGGSWKRHNITAEAILELNSRIRHGSQPIWETVEHIVDEALTRGFISRRDGIA